MRRRTVLRLLSATPLAAWLGNAQLLARLGLAAGPANAATLYRNAVEALRALALSNDDHSRLRNASMRSLCDPDVLRLIERLKPTIQAARVAATIDHCDWEREVLTNDDLLKDRLDSLNFTLAHAICLNALQHARQGRETEALDDLFAALSLAHRVGGRTVLFGRMLETGQEQCAFRALGLILPLLTRPGLDDLAQRLNALPPPEPASAAIGPERRYIVGSIRAKLMKMGDVITAQDWGELGFDPEEAAALQRLTGGHRAALVAHLEATGPAFEELGRRLDLPRPQCRPAFDEFMRVSRTDQPLVASLNKNGYGMRRSVDIMLARRAMLHAGLVLIRDGEPAFRAIRDPFGNGPFGLERRGPGFLIRTALRDDDYPEVTLAIGEAS